VILVAGDNYRNIRLTTRAFLPALFPFKLAWIFWLGKWHKFSTKYFTNFSDLNIHKKAISAITFSAWNNKTCKRIGKFLLAVRTSNVPLYCTVGIQLICEICRYIGLPIIGFDLMQSSYSHYLSLNFSPSQGPSYNISLLMKNKLRCLAIHLCSCCLYLSDVCQVPGIWSSQLTEQQGKKWWS